MSSFSHFEVFFIADNDFLCLYKYNKFDNIDKETWCGYCDNIDAARFIRNIFYLPSYIISTQINTVVHLHSKRM